MLSIEYVESIGLLSVWMLEPRLPELLLELRRLGYATARVRPRSLGGYSITFIEPIIAAIKGSTFILYNPGRRSVSIESSDVSELLHIFNEVERILKDVGSDPAKGALFYELQVKAIASGGKWTLKKVVRSDDLLGLNLLVVPVSFVSVEGDPNSTQWFQLDVRPLWTSWPDERVRYEVVLIYRDDKEKLIRVLESLDEVLRELINRISSTLEEKTA